MSITVGQAVVEGNKVVIKPPNLGTGAARAIRLTNYTANVLILTNIDGQTQSQEYLLPLQQMVYETINVTTVPTVAVLDIGGAIVTPPTVLVEWSTDPLKDFTGTYPTVIGAPSGAPYLYVTQLVVNNNGSAFTFFDYMQIEANPFRRALTLINNTQLDSTDDQLLYSQNPDLFTVDSPTELGAPIARGSGRTFEATATLYFGGEGRSPSNGFQATTMEIIEESWGAQSVIFRRWDA